MFIAGLVVLCGLLLWGTSLGDWWVNTSYDYSFYFGSRGVTNRMVFVMMDDASFSKLHQTRGQPWDRALHARLLNRLADDGCRMVVMDSFFGSLRDPQADAALAEAMRRQRALVLMAEHDLVVHPNVMAAEPELPAEMFLQAARSNWGVAWVDPDLDWIVRKQWPFPSDLVYPSLPEAAARAYGANPKPQIDGRWLRYYSSHAPGLKLSYELALEQPPGFFRDQIVFIGTQPKTTLLDNEPDEFATPYIRWTGESTGGVEIMATAFLNLVHEDWLRRPKADIELAVLIVLGIGLSVVLLWLRPLQALGIAFAAGLIMSLAGVLLCHFTNYWFPWFVVVGGQMPCALGAVLATRYFGYERRNQGNVAVLAKPPVVPGFKLVQPPIGEGAYGKVWLARNRAGEWRAVKVVYLAGFNNNRVPFDREFDGVTKYQAASGDYPGLLHVDFVSKKMADHFYYVMELGDSMVSGWEKKPIHYRPHDLAAERTIAPGKKLSVQRCVEIGLELTETLKFLHKNGLIHRDIKPQNIIFVGGRPKLADLGLIAEIRPQDEIKTLVGTPGFMPPAPELPGTPQGDIFALGMVLYVASTGLEAAQFPDISTTLVDGKVADEFLPFNAVILTACQPDINRRYTSASAFQNALLKLRR